MIDTDRGLCSARAKDCLPRQTGTATYPEAGSQAVPARGRSQLRWRQMIKRDAVNGLRRVSAPGAVSASGARARTPRPDAEGRRHVQVPDACRSAPGGAASRPSRRFPRRRPPEQTLGRRRGSQFECQRPELEATVPNAPAGSAVDGTVRKPQAPQRTRPAQMLLSPGGEGGLPHYPHCIRSHLQEVKNQLLERRSRGIVAYRRARRLASADFPGHRTRRPPAAGRAPSCPNVPKHGQLLGRGVMGL